MKTQIAIVVTLKEVMEKEDNYETVIATKYNSSFLSCCFL